jgi:4-amino-4-deoxy-L-arabinose transferase-like glycosyltransferase
MAQGKKRRTAILGVLGAVVLLTLLGAAVRDSGRSNLYVLQASSYLNGSLETNSLSPSIAYFHGKAYSVLPPFPAVVLMPFVAVLGPGQTYATVLSAALAFLTAIVFLYTMRSLKLTPGLGLWLLGAFMLGTGYWSAVVYSHDANHFAHVVAVACLVISLHQALARRRGWTAGIALGLAVLSRPATVVMALFLAGVFWRDPRFETSGQRRRALLGLAIPLAACGVAFMVLNYLRFWNPFSLGYEYTIQTGPIGERLARFGVLHPLFVPDNFVHMLLQGFNIEFQDNALGLYGVHMDRWGTSILFASPFLLFAFWARSRRTMFWTGWASVAVLSVFYLFHATGGWPQVNCFRFSLDYVPALMVLSALALRRLTGRTAEFTKPGQPREARGARAVPDWLWKGAITYSIALNVVALGVVPAWSAAEQALGVRPSETPPPGVLQRRFIPVTWEGAPGAGYPGPAPDGSAAPALPQIVPPARPTVP